jgi:hypothetical protein
LFYYSKKVNFGVIGDLNNVGESSFTFEDLMRFEGGVSNFLSGRKSLSNLYQFTNNHKNFLKNKSQFTALDFNYNASPKLTISGYGIFSKVFTTSKILQENQYIQNDTITFENTSRNNNSRSLLGIGNIKIEFTPSKREKWYYNGQYQFGRNNISDIFNSSTNINSNLLRL